MSFIQVKVYYNHNAANHTSQAIQSTPPPFQNVEKSKSDISFENDILTKNVIYPSKSDITITTPPTTQAMLPPLNNLTPQAIQATHPPFKNVEKTKSDISFENDILTKMSEEMLKIEKCPLLNLEKNNTASHTSRAATT
eukprot:CAMPEP_0194444864 /NCGR_PEP_ID=MMETSP0176-20130528/127523_1 /TAXON_ID=216777 /ORGANISM="Proboscia alata, Strain PI-D3" /LENGTH=138 /DNA_ID=CAMNT_0039271325 /DNA_START=1011 /DNA_END=1428 /DNA_ORIENTATION=-